MCVSDLEASNRGSRRRRQRQVYIMYMIEWSVNRFVWLQQYTRI